MLTMRPAVSLNSVPRPAIRGRIVVRGWTVFANGLSDETNSTQLLRKEKLLFATTGPYTEFVKAV